MRYARKVTLAVLTAVILLTAAFSAYAAVNWDYLITIAPDMHFKDSSLVHVDVMCDADDNDVDKMTVKCELQQYNGSWKTIKTWTQTENDSIVWMEKDYAVAKNYSYRLRITASVYKNSVLLEQVTGEYAEQFYR